MLADPAVRADLSGSSRRLPTGSATASSTSTARSWYRGRTSGISSTWRDPVRRLRREWADSLPGFGHFDYEERPDPFSEYRAGFEIRTRLRCKRIEIRTHADHDRLSRTYELVYLDDRVRAGELPAAVCRPTECHCSVRSGW